MHIVIGLLFSTRHGNTMYGYLLIHSSVRWNTGLFQVFPSDSLSNTCILVSNVLISVGYIYRRNLLSCRFCIYIQVLSIQFPKMVVKFLQLCRRVSIFLPFFTNTFLAILEYMQRSIDDFNLQLADVFIHLSQYGFVYFCLNILFSAVHVHFAWFLH